ncbi:MAG: hypothetical protein M2R45_03490 [Verrucomicrobia subdivision 3 bacterium]|nr:hypothetical protein [Limisphaerales bacterium]MCS1415886.1 hypothetical protein [Limisphaerales bacterium]
MGDLKGCSVTETSIGKVAFDRGNSRWVVPPYPNEVGSAYRSNTNGFDI